MPPDRNGTTCVNSDYLECIRSYLKAAEAQKSNRAFTYRKAYHVIEKHPIRFTSPADAGELPGIGPKTVALLGKWLNSRVTAVPTTKDKRKKTPKQITDVDVGKNIKEEEEEEVVVVVEEPQFPPITPVIFEPGTFDIVLILDEREILSQQERHYIPEQLMARGVSIEVRTLGLGDAVWIARRKDDRTELVLDYIIERKRMDDLVASIKDGRFVEQKIRLKHSGTAHVIYIIEEFDSGAVHAFNPQAITTAIVTTQVVDGFFVKRTSSTEHTIDYLAKLHSKLTAHYSTTRLHGIPDKHVNRSTFLALKSHLSTPVHYVTYTSFGKLNSKSGSVTLNDSFALMLATVRGVSYKTAVKIAKKYGTPHTLFVKYRELDDDESRENLIHNDLGTIVTRTTSANIWKIWFAK